MSARKGCPFCGNLHVKVAFKEDKSFVTCGRCDARGPSYENLANKPTAVSANEAVARWDDRAT